MPTTASMGATGSAGSHTHGSRSTTAGLASAGDTTTAWDVNRVMPTRPAATRGVSDVDGDGDGDSDDVCDNDDEPEVDEERDDVHDVVSEPLEDGLLHPADPAALVVPNLQGRHTLATSKLYVSSLQFAQLLHPDNEY